MKFGTGSNLVAPRWRMILWAVSLVPALLVLGMAAKQARQGRSDAASSGLSANEATRLRHILSEPHPDATEALPDDVVRVLSVAKPSRIDEHNVGKLFDSVTDNAFGIPVAEKPSYDLLLSRARSASSDELRNAIKDVPFAVLMLEPNQFRGKLLSISGEVRRAAQLAESPTSPKQDRTFEAWIFTADSGLNPYRVVFSELPDGIPLSDEIQPPIRVRVTGYFFKRFSYATSKDFHTAPLLLAKTLDVLPSDRHSLQQPRQGFSQKMTFLTLGILFTLAITGLLVAAFVRHRRPVRPSVSGEDAPDFSQWPSSRPESNQTVDRTNG